MQECSSELLLTQVWKGGDPQALRATSTSTGHHALDPHFPGHGWPLDGMVEVLHAMEHDKARREEGHRHVWRLVLPALVQSVQENAGPVALIGAPFAPFGPSLRGQGLEPERLLCIRSRNGTARLWAAEQILRCAEVAAVLAWLPQARAPELRRLHLGAQKQKRLLWVFRPEKVRHEATPARLRLLLEGNEELRVHILKRRGPPLDEPVVLPAVPGELDALLKARRKAPAMPAPGLATPPVPVAPTPVGVARALETSEETRVLDRAAAA